MRKIGAICCLLLVGGCGAFSISDRYGNSYGDWYEAGSDYRWQLDLCEHQMDQQSVPIGARKLAMRCCMRAHGVPIADPADCRG